MFSVPRYPETMSTGVVRGHGKHIHLSLNDECGGRPKRLSYETIVALEKKRNEVNQLKHIYIFALPTHWDSIEFLK